MNIRDRRWDERESAESLWSRLNDAWRDLRTYRMRAADYEDATVGASALATSPGARVETRTAQAVASATVQPVAFTLVSWSTDTEAPIWDPRARTLTIQRAGIYDVAGRVGFTTVAAAAGARAAAIITVDGVNTVQIGSPCAAGSTNQVLVYDSLYLRAGQAVGLAAFQTTGASQNTLVSASDYPMLVVKYDRRSA